MVDVSKVEGPSGSPESFGKKDKGSVDADKFKEAMQRKVKEVSETDPDEQKKRKRREEVEEEKAEEPTDGPTTPPSQVAPFSLKEEGKKVNPLSIQGPGISPTESSQKTSLTSPSTSPSVPPQETVRQPETPRLPPEKTPTAPAVGPPPSTEQKPGPDHPPKKTEPKKEKGSIPIEIQHEPSAKKEDTAAFFEKMSREEKKSESLENEAELQGTAPVVPPQIPSEIEGVKEEKKIEPKETPVEIELGMGAGPPLEQPAPSTPSGPLPSYANLHPQVMEIFDRMVGVMTVMNMSGMTETTVTLNAPQFASSVFFGSQIIIQQYSTAPQAFNIQINGTPQAVALIQGNMDDLMAAFQAGNYNFRVNRLETGYLTERPLFKRKEKAGEKEKDTGENRQ